MRPSVSSLVWALAVPLLVASCWACSVRTPTEPQAPRPPVVFETDLVRQWVRLYENWAVNEWAVCLYGEQRGRTLEVSDQRLAHLYGVWPDSVQFGCDYRGNLVGFVHSHPDIERRACSLSEGDFARAFSDTTTKAVEHSLVVAAMCKGAFVFALREWQAPGHPFRQARVELTPDMYPSKNRTAQEWE